MSPQLVSRRTVLRGTGGIAIGLPFLEAMMPRKALAAGPTRYLATFTGMCTGTDRSPTTGLVVPETFGEDFLSKLRPGPHALAPLLTHGLQGKVTAISNLRLPWGSGPAHWNDRWHPPTMRPLLSGVSSKGDSTLNTPTSDILAARKLGAGSRFEHLALRVQPKRYRSAGPNAAVAGRMSCATTPIEPFVDPGQIFDQLFGGGSRPGTGMPDARAKRDRAVVDLVLTRANRLRQRLGNWDRVRLDQHLTELRDLEKRIATLESDPAAMCNVPQRPSTNFPEQTTSRTGWSNETERAKILTELVYLAFACDLTRSISLMYTFGCSFTAVDTIIGRSTGGQGDIHEIHHAFAEPDDHARVWAWHTGFWASLLARLGQTPDGDGTLLDHTMSVFLSEGGGGSENTMGDLNDDFTSHSGNRMMVLLAGGGGTSFKHRGHLDGRQQHPTQAIVSALRAIGVTENLGEISTGLRELT